MSGWPVFSFGDKRIHVPVAKRASVAVIATESQRVLNVHPDCPFIVKRKGITLTFIQPLPFKVTFT